MTTSHSVRIGEDFEPDGKLSHPEWLKARPTEFCCDWKGANHYPELKTTVLSLWTPASVYFGFRCPYENLHMFDQSPPQRVLNLYERDVAEVFLGDNDRSSRYKEFEVSPNGHWLDLQIDWEKAGPQWDWETGNRVAAWIDQSARIWTAEIKIPISCLDKTPCSGTVWPVNYYRCCGQVEPRVYLAWRATETDQPNYHVPERFGQIRFEA
jgi:hypothetical protein